MEKLTLIHGIPVYVKDLVTLLDNKLTFAYSLNKKENLLVWVVTFYAKRFARMIVLRSSY